MSQSTMKKVAITELDPRLQKQIAGAEQQIKSNPQYSIEILSGIVSRNPGCVEVRRLLRRAQKAVHGTKKGLFEGLMGGLMAGKIAKAVERDPVAALQEAEQMLAKRPTDANANKQIAAAALILEMPELAAFAYEELTEIEPKEVQHFIDLANTWNNAGNYDKALESADAGLKLFPADGNLQEAVRRASVNKTMKRGNWEEKGDFQSKLKDKEEAVRLEQSSRTVTDAGTALEQAAALAIKIQAQPDSLDLYRDIVRQFIAAGDLDSDIAWLQRGRLTTLGQQDTSLERQEFDLITQRLEKIVGQIQTQVAANPNDSALQSQLAQATQELDAYRLQTATTLVERYPNDYAYRFDLGKLLLAANRLDDSIQQLQYAQRNPKYRQSAILLIGKAFVASGKFDLAVEQFNVAKGELPMMNDLKKDVIYELGNAFEKMGRTKEAIEEYKIIYMADSGFRDVAQKINAFYESQKGPTA